MSDQKRYAVIEHYRDGGTWTHTYASLKEAEQSMEGMSNAHRGRTYELIN